VFHALAGFNGTREAFDTGPDTLAVACPSCLAMFTDAAKSEDMDSKLAVKDVAQLEKSRWLNSNSLATGGRLSAILPPPAGGRGYPSLRA